MGYYSIYRIIKDIIRTLFNKKVFKILLIAFIVLFILFNYTEVFATYNFTYNNTNYSLTDLPSDVTDYFCICDDNNGHYSLWYGTSPFTYDNDGRNLLYTTNLKRYVMRGTNGTWDPATSGIWNNQQAYQVATVIVSNHDIYYKNNSSQLYFAGVPAEPSIELPYILNTQEDLSSGKFETLDIEPADFDLYNNSLYLHILYKSYSYGEETENPIYYYTDKTIPLNQYLETFTYEDNITVSYISVERDNLGIKIENDKSYYFVLSSSASNLGGAYNTNNLSFDNEEIFDNVYFTITGLSAEDIENNKYNEIISSNNETNKTIKDSTDKLFSDDYNEEDIQLSTDASDSVDNSSITNFVTTLIQSIQNIATGNWNSVETITVPLGFVSDNIVLRSDLLSSNIPNALKSLINIFWMYLFGLYIFRYTSKLIDWLKSGDILNNKEMSANEVITSSML